MDDPLPTRPAPAERAGGIAADDRLRIVAIGTSNLVLQDGFKQPFQSQPGIEFLNLSVGASGSVLLGLRLDQVPFERTDVLLLEFAVNEENFVKEGSSSLPAVTNAMRGAIDRACRAGCLPVLVLLPNQAFLKAAPAADAMRAAFERSGLPVFDTAHAIRQAAALANIPPASFFRDPKHLKPVIARCAAELLIEALRRLLKVRRAPLRETGARFRPLRYLDASSIVGPHAEVFERRTSLLAATGLVLKADEELVIPGPDAPSSIVGVLVNGARTCGQFAGEGGGSIAFSLPGARWSDDPSAFILVARPVPATPIPPGGRRYRVVRREGAHDRGPPQIELCGLFVRADSDIRAMAITPVARPGRDLAATIDKATLRRIAALAQADA